MFLSFPTWEVSLFILNMMSSLYLGRAKRIWYLSPMRAAKVQASLRIRAVSPEPSLLAHTSSESRETFRQKARSLAPLNGWACAVKVCHDGMLEDTNSLGATHFRIPIPNADTIVDWQSTNKSEPPHDKTNKMVVHPAKTRIRLGIHPI